VTLQKITTADVRNLLLASIWSLFLEIWLIRWISTEIRIFAYINNLVLLSCYLGLGAGYALPQKKARLWISFLALTALVVSVHAWPFTMITELLSSFSDTVIWFKTGVQSSITTVTQGVVLTIFIFLLIATVFFPIGQYLGDLFNNSRNTVIAYSINIFGSIIGIWLFSLLSFASAPPFFWFVVGSIPPVFLLSGDRLNKICFGLMIVFCATMMSITSNNVSFTRWTPYQKLTIWPNSINGLTNGFRVNVNNVGYMGLLDLSRNFITQHFGNDTEAMKLYDFNQYELAYKLKPGIKDVLIVGSGGGNDVAGALRNGVDHVDAVEIDPVIYETGLELHPENPYGDKRVNITITDARSFFQINKGRKLYDLVAFGLLDSHTLNSSYNNIRLDHYVYTKESIEQVKQLLKPDGLLVLSFEVQNSWIYSRIYHLLQSVFNQPPLTSHIRSPKQAFGWGGMLFVESLNPAALRSNIDSNPELRQLLENTVLPASPTPVKLSTDDWPYLYLEKAEIPTMYILVLTSLALLFACTARLAFPKGSNRRTQLHFFFLGAAFMLLEFQNISKASLMFGATWIVNAYTITAILILILCANAISSCIRKYNFSTIYIFLFATISILYFLPTSFHFIDNFFGNNLIICIIYNLPVLFAGLIFIDSFSKTEEKSAALGANLFGASLGGMLESMSFVTGMRALIILVAVLYLCSYVAARPHGGKQASTAS
jgi:spermidine synthase